MLIYRRMPEHIKKQRTVLSHILQRQNTIGIAAPTAASKGRKVPVLSSVM